MYLSRPLYGDRVENSSNSCLSRMFVVDLFIFTICTSSIVYKYLLLAPKVLHNLCFSIVLCTIEVTNFVTLLWTRHFPEGKSRSLTKLRRVWRFLSTCFIIKRTKMQLVFDKVYPKSYYNIKSIPLACSIFLLSALITKSDHAWVHPSVFWHLCPILSSTFYRKKQELLFDRFVLFGE